LKAIPKRGMANKEKGGSRLSHSCHGSWDKESVDDEGIRKREEVGCCHEDTKDSH